LSFALKLHDVFAGFKAAKLHLVADLHGSLCTNSANLWKLLVLFYLFLYCKKLVTLLHGYQ
jgi:hypothetical protein